MNTNVVPHGWVYNEINAILVLFELFMKSLSAIFKAKTDLTAIGIDPNPRVDCLRKHGRGPYPNLFLVVKFSSMRDSPDLDLVEQRFLSQTCNTKHCIRRPMALRLFVHKLYPQRTPAALYHVFAIQLRISRISYNVVAYMDNIPW